MATPDEHGEERLSRAREHRDRGDRFLAAGRWDEATAEYLDAVLADPTYARARHNLGVAYYKQGFLEQAAAEVEKALGLEPDHVDFLFTLGLIKRDARAFQAALDCFSAAIERDPEHTELWHSRAHTHYEAGDIQAATADFERVVELAPEHADALYDLAVAYAAAERWPQAEQAFERCLALAPDNAEVYYNLGLAHAQDVNTPDEEAEWAFLRALELAPDHVSAQFYLGALYAKAKRESPEARQKAITTLQSLGERPEIDQILPAAHVLYFALGSLYDDEPDTHDRARKCYAACLDLQPDFAPAHNNLGILNRREGDAPAAASHFVSAILADPSYENPYENLARLCYDSSHDLLQDCLDELLLETDSTRASEVTCRLILAFVDVARAAAHQAGYRKIHQLKNSLAVSAARLRRAARSAEQESSALLEELRTIAEGQERVFEGMQQFLAALHHRELEFALVNVGELVETVLAQAAERAGDAVEIRWEPPGLVPEIKGDAGRLRDMLTNLVNNALEAMPDGGRLTLRLVPRREARSGRGTPAFTGVKLIVADTGRGMTEKVQEQVFREGYTTKEGGSGYGLAIAAQVAREHRGTLRLESRPDSGTQAVVELPLNLGVTSAGARMRLRPIVFEDPRRLIRAEFEGI